MREETKNIAHIRFDILKTVYTLSNGIPEQMEKIFPVQIDNCTFQDMHYHLETMKERGYVDFTPHLLLRTFHIALTTTGAAIVKDVQDAFCSKDPDRDQRMRDALARLK